MPLVTTKEMLLKAQKEVYAVGAFNVENIEMILAVIEVAEHMKSPVILQATPSTTKYLGVKQLYANVKAAAEGASVPIAIHLDHGNSFELAMEAFREGFTSIMIDGSHESYETNINLTRSVVAACHSTNVPVEAELGKVGGKEDDLDGGLGGYTDPLEAKVFVERTQVDFLAVAIGTAHGVYQGEPKLDLQRLAEIHQNVTVPLVLHGTSGVADDTVKECIKRGICKVNYATDLRIAFTKGVNQVLLSNPNTIDPKKYGLAGKEEVKKYVMSKIKVVGSEGKA